ncbi:hypothetical protein BH23BAC2_BH23BAC2_09130 [soil metagenome]
MSDPEKRKKYDQYGKDLEHADEFKKAKYNQSSGPRETRASQNAGDFSDFFEDMFGSTTGRARQVRFKGEDLQASLQLSLKDAYKSHKHTLNVNGKSIRINIPAGIENGQIIKISEHGRAWSERWP